MPIENLVILQSRPYRYFRLGLVFFFSIVTTFAFGQWSDLKKAPVEQNRMLLNLRWIDSSFFFAHTNKLIYFSENGREITRTRDMNGTITQFQMITKKKGIAIVASQQKKPLLLTLDGGFTWDTLTVTDGIDTLNSKVTKYHLYFQDTLHGFVFADSVNGYTNTWVTHDGGSSWMHLDSQSSPKHSFHDLLNAGSSGDPKSTSFGSLTIFNSAYPLRVIYKARNYFTIWEEMQIPLSVPFYNNLCCIDTLIWLGNTLIGSPTAKIITYNGGGSWQSLSFPGTFLAPMHFVQGAGTESGFIISGSTGSFVSIDTGKNWQKLDTFFHKDFRFLNSKTGLSVVNVYPDSGAFRLFEGIGNWVGERKLSSYHGVVYPNPSDNQITILETILVDEICWYNPLGELVLRHSVENTANSGLYTFNYDLPPGNYLIRLRLANGNIYALWHSEY